MSLEDTYDPALVEDAADRLVIISGCSGGGKSTLLGELARRGHAVCEEAGRQVVKKQLYIGGDALPWGNAAKFVELTVSRTINNMINAARSGRLTFFDRGIIDQVAGGTHAGLAVPEHVRTAARRLRCNWLVFLAPPWREIFATDAERRHGFEEAASSFEPLRAAYQAMEYAIVELPRISPGRRADFVLNVLLGTGN
ncbi:MAG: AAA family ATPase [Sphingomonadales bacterium]